MPSDDESTCLKTVKPQTQWSVEDWLDYQLRLHPANIELGLERIQTVGARLGVLHPRATVVTVAGTNGKGSSVAMLEAIMVAAGYQVGAYTSPHLLRYNERIRLNGQEVEDEALIAAFNAVEAARKETPLTFFEYGTLAALWLFSRQFLDMVILEVGLGGRLDATNVVDADLALITAIDVDHADWLGDDREVIGREKAGIMRSGRPVIISDPKPPQSVLEYAEKIDAQPVVLGQAFNYRAHQQGWDYLGGNILRSLPRPALAGDFQLQNAAGVLALLERLPPKFYLHRRYIEAGLAQVRHPGRLMWQRAKGRRWLLDVAHNPQSAQMLAAYLAEQSGPFEAVFAALGDKDIVSMVHQLRPYFKHWHLVPLEAARALSPEALKQTVLEAGVPEVQMTLHPTMAAALSAVSPEAIGVIWGSFITVGAAMEALSHG